MKRAAPQNANGGGRRAPPHDAAGRGSAPAAAALLPPPLADDDRQLPFGFGSGAGAPYAGGEAGDNAGGGDAGGLGSGAAGRAERWLAVCHQAGVLGVALYDRVRNEVGRGAAGVP
jgi:hypothetical protein